jgi:hypothetical protein
MKNNNSNNICGYSDTDWAGSFDRNQQSIFAQSRSSAEAEYRVMTSTTSELICIKQLLADMGIEYKVQ